MTDLAGASGRGQGPPIDDFVAVMECKSPRRWRVEGDAILRFAQMTNWDYYEAALRFQKVLEASGMPSKNVLEVVMQSQALLGPVHISARMHAAIRAARPTA